MGNQLSSFLSRLLKAIGLKKEKPLTEAAPPQVSTPEAPPSFEAGTTEKAPTPQAVEPETAPPKEPAPPEVKPTKEVSPPVSKTAEEPSQKTGAPSE
jgi:hypothetical protein